MRTSGKQTFLLGLVSSYYSAKNMLLKCKPEPAFLCLTSTSWHQATSPRLWESESLK